MPELPEVENLVLELGRTVSGRRIKGVEIRNRSILENPPAQFKKKIPGKTIQTVSRRGKFIRMDLSGGVSLWFHLGMTGQLLLGNAALFSKSHVHFGLQLEGTPSLLVYRDVRRFGRVAVTPEEGRDSLPAVERLGPEPREWESGTFAAQMKARKGRIKSLLLNQNFMAGLGNIYADESLYRAGIRPLKRACQVSRKRLFRLHQTICEVLEEATRWGGSSIDDYRHLDGRKGLFQQFHYVYGRNGQDCLVCGTRIRSVKLAGRTSSFCPHCQP